MRSITMCLIAGIIVSSAPVISAQTIRRVDNNPSNEADFTSIQAAHDAATQGDIVHVAGSGVKYSGFNVSKQLTIIGPGYFLSENPETQNRAAPAKVGAIEFNSGSENSIVMGLEVEASGTIIQINTNSITVKRNKIGRSPSSGYHGISVGPSLTDILITQNYIQVGAHLAASPIGVLNDAQNVIIHCNYIENTVTNWEAVIDGATTASLEIINNIITASGARSIAVTNSIIQNNIVRAGGYSGSGNIIRNNLTDSSQFDGLGSANQSSVDMNSVFTNSGSTDGQWKIKSGSPALGTGVNGEDLGMFGGTDPYVLSGLPNVPAIFFLNAPSTGSAESGLPVQIKVKSHN